MPRVIVRLFRRKLKEAFSFLFFLQCSLNPKVKRTAKIDFTAKEKNLNSENQRAPLYLLTLILLFSALYDSHVFMKAVNSKRVLEYSLMMVMMVMMMATNIKDETNTAL